MTDAQTLRQVAQARTPFSAWLGVVLLFLLFGLLVFAVIGPSVRGSDYEQKRAANRAAKLKAQREQDAAALSGYAWVDKNKGTVRIPIERAMELSLTESARKKPSAAGPIATPAPSEAPATAGAAATPSGSPAPSATPKGATVEGHGAKAQPAAGTNPPGAAPGTQPGASASPAASPSSATVPASPPPPAATPPSAGTPLPVRGKSPEGQ
jgi:hypothetical protein